MSAARNTSLMKSISRFAAIILLNGILEVSKLKSLREAFFLSKIIYLNLIEMTTFDKIKFLNEILSANTKIEPAKMFGDLPETQIIIILRPTAPALV